MASKLATAVGQLVEEITRDGVPPDDEALARLVRQVAEGFGVRNDEVAILSLSSNRKFLHFVVPEKLRQVGSIPLTSTSALAVRTARERRPEVINNFATVRHASVFESVPLAESEPSDPIQKIMSAPIVADNQVLGVLQISRKAHSQAAAGADFTPKDLAELVDIGALMGPCLKLLPHR